MSVDGELLDATYAVYEEFGLDRQFLGKIGFIGYFQLTASEMDALMVEMAEIPKTVWSIAELSGEAKIGMDKISFRRDINI